MSHLLSLNCGSTSVKYKLFQIGNGNESYLLRLKKTGGFSDHQISDKIFQSIIGELTKFSSPTIIGHRVVQAGPKYREAIKITSAVIAAIKKYQPLAPLHNPYNLKGIILAKKYFPAARHFAVFDTGFYKNLPAKAKIYPLPYEFYKKYHIFKYGFHGLSHQYAARQAAQILKKDLKSLNLIICHLGGGASITAIAGGQAIDTSMGFTPLEGLMMWSRPGDIDIGILLNHQLTTGEKEKKNKNGDIKILRYWEQILNYESGLKGISECLNYLDLLKKRQQGNPKAKLAFEMFIYRIQKYIGAYFTALSGRLDGLVFTGQIGAGKPITRQAICRNLGLPPGIKKLVIPADEEYEIARSVMEKIAELNLYANI